MMFLLIRNVFFIVFLSFSCAYSQVAKTIEVAATNDAVVASKAIQQSVQQPQQEAAKQDLDAMQGVFAALAGQQAGGTESPMNMVDAQKMIEQFLQSAMKRRLEGEMKKRTAALKVLTEEEQKIVMDAHDAYQSVTQIVSIPQTLTKLCVSVREMVAKVLIELKKQRVPRSPAYQVIKNCGAEMTPEELASNLAQEEYVIKLDLSLEKLHEALLSGTFKNILKSMIGGGDQGGFSPEMMMNPEALMSKLADGVLSGKKQEETEYTPDDLRLLCGLLQEEFKTVPSERKGSLLLFKGIEHAVNNKKEYSLLLKYLEAVKASDMILLAHLVFEYNAPEIEAAQKQLESVSAFLNSKFREAIGIDVKDYIKERQRAAEGQKILGGDVARASVPLRSLASHHDAYIYWYRELKKFSQTIATFNELKEGAQLSGGESSVSSMDLFRNFAYACDLGTGFFDLYKREHALHGFTKTEARLLVPYALDWSIRGGMSYWYYREMQAKMLRGSALQVAVGESGLAAQNQQLMMFSRFGAIAMALPVLWKPSFYFKRPNDFLLGASKIAVAWSYYHTAHMELFGKGSKRELWPSSNTFLIEALVYGARMGTHAVSQELAWQVRRSVGHETLETLENYSWGVIDPEMIHAVMDSMIPYLFLNLPKGFVNTTRSRAYGSWYENGVAEAFEREFKKDPNNSRFDAYRKRLIQAGGKGVSSEEILNTYYESSNLGSVDGYYLEHMLMDYTASSIGRYWGRRITLAFKGPVASLASKVVDLGMDCLEAVGLISSDSAEAVLMWRDDLSEDMDVVVGHLKELTMMMVSNQSPVRPVLLQYLVEYGYLDKDEKDEFEINRSIIILILNQLIVNRLFTNSQAAEIIQACDNNNEIFLLEPAVDKIIEGLRDSVIGLFGGFVGSEFLRRCSEYLCWQYGPFYPKIKGALSR